MSAGLPTLLIISGGVFLPNPIFGCIGRHLSHSYSKEIHELLADYDYELYPLEPENLRDFIKNPYLGGINVTIPYKKDVIKYIDRVDKAAKKIGAVNTIVSRDGKLYGYNTDVYGMERLLQKNGIELVGRKVLILGTGGTSLTAKYVCEKHSAREALRVSRTKKPGVISYEEAVLYHTDAEVIINTTPLGMYPDNIGKLPISLEPFRLLQGVADAVYNPLRSALVLEAEKRGIKSCGGLYMLVNQAVKACELFTDTEISGEKSDTVYNKIYASKCNIVLTGMPACGKTTAAKILAEKTGREVFDTDTLCEQHENMTVSQIFAEKGEAYFRQLESEMISSLKAKTGVIISVGGGAVLKEENVNALKANGLLFFIDRPLEKLLPTPDRPLASSAEAIKKRYEERIDIYNSTADIKINPSDNPNETAEDILKRLGEIK